MPETGRLAAQRKHTLYFLRHARATAPVFLDTDVDMTTVVADRERVREAGGNRSVISYVLAAVTRVLQRHPEANSAVSNGLLPKVVRHTEVRPKVAMDRTLNGQRVVLSAVLPDLRSTGLDRIQHELEHCRDTPAPDLPQLRGTLLLHRLPTWLGWPAFRLTLAKLPRRADLMGTVAVSSLGHRDVNGFHAVGGTAITVNLGQIRQQPVVRGGAVTAAPVLRLNLAFDHRVIDGAEAADVVTEIKQDLESGVGLPAAGPREERTSPTAQRRVQE